MYFLFSFWPFLVKNWTDEKLSFLAILFCSFWSLIFSRKVYLFSSKIIFFGPPEETACYSLILFGSSVSGCFVCDDTIFKNLKICYLYFCTILEKGGGGGHYAKLFFSNLFPIFIFCSAGR